ncbi:MAG TPA: O-antigen ligase family protein [Acidobacteriota bacterium]|nr:O-antigen ligase family protein [Acidobacteriota bacterium]
MGSNVTNSLAAKRRSGVSAVFGAIILIQMANDIMMGWWFPWDPNNEAIRFWPHFFHALLMIQVIAYFISHFRQMLDLRVVRYQILWLGILTLRFLYSGNITGSLTLYMSYYAFWVFVFWGCYCMVANGHLKVRQVAVIGTVLNALFALRTILYISFGFWIGVNVGYGSPSDHIANAAYPMLWFTLMQMLDLKIPFGKSVALLGAATIVLSTKRGALIALIVSSIAYGISYAYIHRQKRGFQRVALVSVLLAIVIAAMVWVRAADISARWSDLGDPEVAGSGRAVFWALIAQNWLIASPITKVIGYGPHSVYDLTGDSWFVAVPAHNDWLMLLHEFGILGLVSFIGILLVLASNLPRLIRNCPQLAPAFTAALAGALCVMAFDLFCYNTETAFFSLLIAVPLGICERRFSSRAVRKPRYSLLCRRNAILKPVHIG